MSLNMTIELISGDHMGAEFICHVTKKSYTLRLQSAGYQGYVLEGDHNEEPLLWLSSTYKTKRSSLIAKCLEYFEADPKYHTGILVVGVTTTAEKRAD